MKLGVICESNANAHYRAVFPMHALERRGHSVLWPQGRDTPLRSLVGCELVHCYRKMDRLADLRELARHGVAINFDNDDNYAAAEAVYGMSELEGRRLGGRIARETIALAKVAHLTTTTCAPIAEYYRAAGIEHVSVIGNHLDPAMPGFGSRTDHDGVVIGWVAEYEHRVDAERLRIAAALHQLLEAHADLRVITVGVHLPIQSERYQHIAQVPFRDLLNTVSTFDIGIAPLADTPFNRSRSDVKLKEYAAVGAAWLASPVGPYRDLGEAQGGMLVGDHDWVAKTGELISSARKRRRLAKRASRWAQQQAIDRHVELWEGAFAETIERVNAGAYART